MKKYTDKELSECPTITIEGKAYPIPVFGPRQNRRIVPLISELRGVTVATLTIEKMDALYNAIYWALTRAHEIAERDYLDWDFPVQEAMQCIPVIARQTGLMKDNPKNAATVKDLAALLQAHGDQEQVIVYEFVKKEDDKGEDQAATESTSISSSQELSPPQD